MPTSITIDKIPDEKKYGADRMKNNINSVRSSSDLYRAARKHASKIVSVDI